MQSVPAVRVDGRYFGLTLPFLNMHVGIDELPDPADREVGRADAYWVCAASLFQGAARPLLGELVATSEPLRLHGTTAIAETADSFFVVVTGYQAVEPAVWFMLPRGAAAANLDDGTEGPTLSIETTDWRLELRQVSRLLRQTSRHQTNQERELAQALAKPPAQQVPAPTLPITPSSPSEARVQAMAGYFVQRHQSGLMTSLVDPSEDKTSGLSRLLATDWLPLNVLARQYRLTIGGIGPGWPAAPPDGALPPPLCESLFALPTPSVTSSAVAEQLWPGLLDDGRLSLAPDEQVEQTWHGRGAQVEKLDVHGDAGLPSPMSKHVTHECTYALTTHRVVMLGDLAQDAAVRLQAGDTTILTGPVPPGLEDDLAWKQLASALRQRLAGRPAFGGGFHLRWEWLQGVTMLTEQLAATTKRTSLFSKTEVPPRILVWLYVDVALPDGTGRRVEISHGEGLEDAAAIEARRRRVLELVGARLAVSPPSVAERSLVNGSARLETSVVSAPGYSILCSTIG